MIVEPSGASLDQRRTTTVNNEDVEKRRREGEGRLESCFPSSSSSSWRKPPGICVTVKGLLTETPGYHGRNSACLVVHVSSFKQLDKGSLTAPSIGILLEPRSCLRSAHLARMFDSTLMSSVHAKHGEKKDRLS